MWLFTNLHVYNSPCVYVRVTVQLSIRDIRNLELKKQAWAQRSFHRIISPVFSRSKGRRISRHGLQDICTWFSTGKMEANACSFSGWYPEDISCCRFEVILFFFLNLFSKRVVVPHFELDIVYFLFIQLSFIDCIMLKNLTKQNETRTFHGNT